MSPVLILFSSRNSWTRMSFLGIGFLWYFCVYVFCFLGSYQEKDLLWFTGPHSRINNSWLNSGDLCDVCDLLILLTCRGKRCLCSGHIFCLCFRGMQYQHWFTEDASLVRDCRFILSSSTCTFDLDMFWGRAPEKLPKRVLNILIWTIQFLIIFTISQCNLSSQFWLEIVDVKDGRLKYVLTLMWVIFAKFSWLFSSFFSLLPPIAEPQRRPAIGESVPH